MKILAQTDRNLNGNQEKKWYDGVNLYNGGED